MLAVAACGGYFNGGLGILLLALFGLLEATQLQRHERPKNWVSAYSRPLPVIYAAGGVVQWPQALMMMVAATAGRLRRRRAWRRHSRPLAARRHRGHRAGDGRAVLAAISRLVRLPSVVQQARASNT